MMRWMVERVGFGHVAGEPVELGDAEDRPVQHRGRRLIHSGTVVATGAGETTVNVDPVLGDAERLQLFDLDFDVLLVGRAACVAA
jgi:hypothetical protein